jgi:gamma-glutamylcyclotransferase (GGCT)/AIG2-like uncharacterized protein YtfP
LADLPAAHVLAVYGTLRPGESNYGVVAPIVGTWLSGTIRGTLGRHPTGRYEGYPAFRHDPAAGEVDVDVLVSSKLPGHWDRLDAFEGPGYRRVMVEVVVPDGRLQAFVYESWPEGETVERR